MNRREMFDPVELREMRKEAGLTQQEMADKLGISRETVLAIENADYKDRHKVSLDSIGLKTFRNWWNVCRSRISDKSRSNFKNSLLDFFNIKF